MAVRSSFDSALASEPVPLERWATAVRFLAADMIDSAKSGHPGMPLGMADVATVLWARHLRFDAADPQWPDRDRFILSAGHGSALLYSLAWLNGFAGVDVNDLQRFRQLGSPAAGHPEFGHFPGVETTTGPLGQGLANAVGMAIAEERLRFEFGDDLCSHRTWVVAGDGCLMEGISQEAISLAGHLRLSRLCVLWDDNRITIDGPTDISTSDDQIARFEASGWNTISIDGHDPEQIDRALTAATASEWPTLVACRTVIGKGAPTQAGQRGIHGSPIGQDEREKMALALDWPFEAFEIPADVLDAWRTNGQRGAADRADWQQRLDSEPRGATLQQRLDGPSTEQARRALEDLACEVRAKPRAEATRVSSATALGVFVDALPGLFGGSADLSGSNGTLTSKHVVFDAADRSGNYLEYGIREHAMAAAMNGLALHGGFLPYGGTFLVFSDYSRPAIRLSALMGIAVVHVLTHDSIGVGEDGPTHQPVEHLCALRAIPNLTVLRPGDAHETIECWNLILDNPVQPYALVLSRQSVDPINRPATSDSGVHRGGYRVDRDRDHDHDHDRVVDVVLLASGSEVGVAVEASVLLADADVNAAVVSIPSMELFEQQTDDYRSTVLGTAPRIAVEASIGQSWQRWLREGDRFVGMNGYGASGPAPQLYAHFGITAESVRDAALERIALSPSTLPKGSN